MKILNQFMASSLFSLCIDAVCSELNSFSEVLDSLPVYIINTIIKRMKDRHVLDDKALLTLLVPHLKDLDISGSLGVVGTRDLGYVSDTRMIGMYENARPWI